MCGNFFTQTLNKKTNRGKCPFGCQAFENSFKDNIYLRTQTLKRNHIVVKCVESVSHKLCTETNTGKSHFSCPVCENCLRDNLYIKTDIPMRNHKVSDVVCSIVFGTRSVPLHLLWIGTKTNVPLISKWNSFFLIIVTVPTNQAKMSFLFHSINFKMELVPLNYRYSYNKSSKNLRFVPFHQYKNGTRFVSFLQKNGTVP